MSYTWLFLFVISIVLLNSLPLFDAWSLFSDKHLLNKLPLEIKVLTIVL